ncbi:hypothetical protein BX616_009687 [Lobosporangium transversale]|nr:hypothetical protein BX616_009687 [Lobosporangium transversale]
MIISSITVSASTTRTTTACFFLLLSLLSYITSPAAAQYYTPTTTWGSVSTFIEAQRFIIQGGSDGTYAIPQTFEIDLSKSWDTSNVPYRHLADGPSAYNHYAVLFNDKQNWLIFANTTAIRYTISHDTWGTNIPGTYLWGIGAARDPNTGYAYVPNGHLSNGIGEMVEYNLVNGEGKLFPMHPNLDQTFYYSIAWSEQARKMILFGGRFQGKTANSNLYTWDSRDGWSRITPNGPIPSPRYGACMVSAYGGAKMILFGGIENTALSDIYILDISNMTWTKGADAGTPSARGYAACAVSNDLFIAWGGGGGGIDPVITSNLTVIYNIKKNAWQSTYSPIPETDPSFPSGGGSPALGAIIGGAVGGLAIIALVIGFFVYRKRQQAKKAKAPVSTSTPQHPTNGEMTVAATGAGAAEEAASVDPGKVAQYATWQYQHPQPQSQPQPTVYSQAPYALYQPPVIHDYQQPSQIQPQIFQPQSTPSQQHQQAYENAYQQQNTYVPPSSGTAPVYSPQPEAYQQPTIYQPAGGPVTNISPLFEHHHQQKSETPTIVPSQSLHSPQLMAVSDSYVDGGSPRRSPQGIY